MNKTWVLHIDGDGFFAYCEIARFPHLWGKPVVVGQERGIATAMTYEAKALGIKRGMPIFKIRDQFPEVTVMPSHFELYEHYAKKLFSIVGSKVDVIERYSIDECFALIKLPHSMTKTELLDWLTKLKEKVQSQIGLTYSFGMARTKVLAKIASKKEKPDGCTLITEEDENQYLLETDISSVWGIGRSLSKRIYNMRITNAYQFKCLDLVQVSRSFASPVVSLWHEICGRKILSVSNNTDLRKSIQSTKSFVPHSSEFNFLVAELIQNLDIALCRARDEGLLTNSISIFFKTSEYKYCYKSIELKSYTNNPLDVASIVINESESIFEPKLKYKSTGVTLSNLRHFTAIQDDLFGIKKEVSERGKLLETVDSIRERFGHNSIGFVISNISTKDRATKREKLRENDNYVYGLPLPFLGETT